MIHALSPEDVTGVLDSDPVFDLTIDDNDLINALTYRLRESKSYWEEERDLKNRRELLEDYWRGKHRSVPLYDYQFPAYVDNRIYMHTEHMTQTVNAQLPQPVVASLSDAPESKRLSHNFGTYLLAFAEQNRWRDHFRTVTRNLLLSFQGVIKIRWDELAGPLNPHTGLPLGDVVIEPVRPQLIVVDRFARPFSNPPFVAHIIREPLDDTLRKFPKKKGDILERLGIRGVKSQLGRQYAYWEVHFSYIDKGAPREGVVWFSEEMNMVLGKMKTPDWDETGITDPLTGQTTYRNLLQQPMKPFAFLSMNNLGREFIDETTPIEQLIPLQDILNQRGQQIKDNAEEVKGGKVFNKRTISKEDAARITNDPGAHILVNGEVNTSVANIAPPPMPGWVINDKFDARSEGDNIVGVHGPTRGERAGADQPTTIQLLKEGDFQRRSDLINGLERMAEYSYRYAAHLMKLHYTEEHFLSALGETGTATFISLTNDKIPDNVSITVKAGSTLPTDKLTQREEALELMRLGKIDYVTFFERLGFPNPSAQAEKLYQHETAPETLYIGASDAEEAKEDVERLKGGNIPALPDRVSEQYMAVMVSFMKSPQFSNLTEDKKVLVQEYITEVIELAKLGAVEAPVEQPMETPQAGTPEKPGIASRAQAMGQKIGQGVRTIIGGR